MEANKRYTRLKRIYSGPYSDIYQAKDDMDQLVALKVVDLDITLKPHNIKQEVKILKKMKSPRVLEYIHDYKYQDDMVLVTKYYPYNLDQLLQAKYSRKTTKFNLDDPTNNSTVYTSKLDNRSIELLLLGLADGLRYIHLQGIIHRDLKPANVYFVDDITLPVIGDFGISYDNNDIGEEVPDAKYTDIASGMYKPPELCFGVTDYNYEVDIWSLGIIITMLYSTNFKSILTTFEIHNDLSLINALFTTFGTPYTKNGLESDPLFWPRMIDDKYHFKAFEFTKRDRKPIDQILPKCDNQQIGKLFNEMMVYEGTKRITTEQLYQGLVKVTTEQNSGVST